MKKKPLALEAGSVLAKVDYPDYITLGDGTQVPTMDLALAIANDSHPGDDVIGPHHLRDTAVAVTDIAQLALFATAGRVRLDHSILPRVIVNASGDDLLCLAAMALDDYCAVTPTCNPCLGGRSHFDIDDAALVVVLGALLYVVRGRGDTEATDAETAN